MSNSGRCQFKRNGWISFCSMTFNLVSIILIQHYFLVAAKGKGHSSLLIKPPAQKKKRRKTNGGGTDQLLEDLVEDAAIEQVLVQNNGVNFNNISNIQSNSNQLPQMIPGGLAQRGNIAQRDQLGSKKRRMPYNELAGVGQQFSGRRSEADMKIGNFEAPGQFNAGSMLITTQGLGPVGLGNSGPNADLLKITDRLGIKRPSATYGLPPANQNGSQGMNVVQESEHNSKFDEDEFLDQIEADLDKSLKDEERDALLENLDKMD